MGGVGKGLKKGLLFGAAVAEPTRSVCRVWSPQGRSVSGGRQSRCPDLKRRPGSAPTWQLKSKAFSALLFGERDQTKTNSLMRHQEQSNEA
jgi:hypothetical protein